MGKRVFKDVAVLLACGTGLLYVLGQTYYAAWLRSWGLSSSYLPRDTPELLQLGFAPFYTYGLWAMILLIPALGVILFLAKLSLKLLSYLLIRYSPNFYKSVSVGWSSGVSDSEESKLEENGTEDNDVSDFIFTCMFFVFLAALCYAVFGAWRAEDIKQEVYERNRTIFEVDKNEISVITCSKITSLCAVFDYSKEAVEIKGLAKLDGARIISRPKSLFEKHSNLVSKD